MDMNKKISEFQVGILTLAAIVILIVGLLWFKNIDLNKNTRVYLVDFEHVEGMVVGDRVQVRGIRMGEVIGMVIQSESVRVEIKLDGEVPLREDAIITLGEKGIVGEIVLEVNPGTGALVQEGHIFKGRTAGTIAAMTDAAGAALQEMRNLTAKVTQLVDQIKDDGKVVETLAQANFTLAKVDTMLDQNHKAIDVILDNLVTTTNSLRELLESGQVDRTFADASDALARADSLMMGLDSSVAKLDTLLFKLTEGNGSAARLINDPMLYDRADSTMASVKRLVDAMRRNPKRYFNVNIMDF